MSRDMSLLHPSTQRKVRDWLDECQSKGYKVLVYETYRTEAEQESLYQQGRTNPGSIVTSATGASYLSCHQWGIAVDFCQNVAGNLYPEPFMTDVARIANKHGLDWGGDWKSFPDKPHLQDRDFLQGGQSPKPLIAKYGTGKKGFEAFKKTWEETKMAKYPNLKMSDKSDKVKELQNLLNRSGLAGPLIAEDGQFGTATNNALKQYQMAKKLPITGACGTYDWLALLGKGYGAPPDKFKEAVAWTVLEGIFNGDGKGGFDWQSTMTTGQYAATLYNMFNNGLLGGE